MKKKKKKKFKRQLKKALFAAGLCSLAVLIGVLLYDLAKVPVRTQNSHTEDVFAEADSETTDVIESDSAADVPAENITGAGISSEEISTESTSEKNTSAAEQGGSKEESTAQEETEEETAVSEQKTEAVAVKGIYVTGPMAGTAKMDDLIAMVEETELNALVIDIKNDEGQVVCQLDTPTVSRIGSVKRYVRDMPGLIQKCKEKGIYLIARIVAFKDPFLAEAMPEWSLKKADGSIFLDGAGLAWVNPYEEGVWEYLLEIAAQAAALGFDEIQFDYIRFSTDKGIEAVDFGPKSAGKSKMDVIAEFTSYACDRLHELGVKVSADVYGVVIDREVDQRNVGQDYVRMSRSLDYICPMIYPSHYGPYNYDIPVPDAQPYDTILAAMQSSKKVLAGSDGMAAANEQMGAENVENEQPGTEITVNGQNGAEMTADTVVNASGMQPMTKEEIAALAPMEGVRAGVRPWLQDFTATWVKGHITYGPQQIREQIRAVYDAGYEEWILWNASNRYTKDGLLPEESERQ